MTWLPHNTHHWDPEISSLKHYDGWWKLTKKLLLNTDPVEYILEPCILDEVKTQCISCQNNRFTYADSNIPIVDTVLTNK